MVWEASEWDFAKKGGYRIKKPTFTKGAVFGCQNKHKDSCDP